MARARRPIPIIPIMPPVGSSTGASTGGSVSTITISISNEALASPSPSDEVDPVAFPVVVLLELSVTMTSLSTPSNPDDEELSTEVLVVEVQSPVSDEVHSALLLRLPDEEELLEAKKEKNWRARFPFKRRGSSSCRRYLS